MLNVGLSPGLDEDKARLFPQQDDGDETQRTWRQSFISIPINLNTTSQPPTHEFPEMLFSQFRERTPFLLATETGQKGDRDRKVPLSYQVQRERNFSEIR